MTYPPHYRVHMVTRFPVLPAGILRVKGRERLFWRKKSQIYYQARDSETWRLKYPLKQPYVLFVNEHYATVLLTSRSRSRNDASLKASGGALMASFIYRRDAAATHDAIKHPEWTLIIPQLLLGPLHFMILILSSSPLLRTC